MKCNFGLKTVAKGGTYLEKGVCFFVFKKIKDKFKSDKWTMYLFYNGICIKKIKIRGIDDIDTMSIVVIGHKALFGSHLVRLVVKPTKVLKTDEKAKKTYWGVVHEQGVDI